MGSCTTSKRNMLNGEVNDPVLVKKITISPSNFVFTSTHRFSQFYKIGKRLGGGAYGEVYICYHRTTATPRAVKVLNRSAIDEDDVERFYSEINILKMMDHPNIVRLYEVYKDSKRYYLVTELCTGGELFDKLAKEKALSERDAAHILRQVLAAVAYCHAKKVVHRDLKPENLLLESADPTARIKVIDFGTSQVFNPGKKMTTKIGTPRYVAPEVLTKSYTEKCDVWSCGVILYVLLSGKQPFFGTTEAEVLHKIRIGVYTMNGPKWEVVSSSAKDLVKKMLMYEPIQRYTALEALEHPWMKKEEEEKVSISSTRLLLNDLKTFSTQHKLQQAALTYIVSQLVSSKEKEELQKTFLLLDQDKDGRLGKEELIEGYKNTFGEGYPAEDEVEKIMEKLDIDGNGYIDLTEFVIATIDKKNLLSRERLVAAFNMFDKDGSGAISAEEVKEILGVGINIPDKLWREIISEVDQNGDGEISLEEFVTMMQKLLND